MIKELENKNISKFPRTCLLVGNDNIVKDRFIEEFLNEYNLEYEDITNSLNLDYINEIYTRSGFYLYHIDADKLTIKNQNIILKFIEEPLENTFIFLRTKNTQNVIPTIKGRCYIFNLGQFSHKYNDLINTDEDKKVLDEYGYDLDEIRNLCNKYNYDFIKFTDIINISTFPIDYINSNPTTSSKIRNWYSSCKQIYSFYIKDETIDYNSKLIKKNENEKSIISTNCADIYPANYVYNIMLIFDTILQEINKINKDDRDIINIKNYIHKFISILVNNCVNIISKGKKKSRNIEDIINDINLDKFGISSRSIIEDKLISIIELIDTDEQENISDFIKVIAEHHWLQYIDFDSYKEYFINYLHLNIYPIILLRYKSKYDDIINEINIIDNIDLQITEYIKDIQNEFITIILLYSYVIDIVCAWSQNQEVNKAISDNFYPYNFFSK